MTDMLQVLIYILQSVGNKPEDDSGCSHMSEGHKNSTGLQPMGLFFPGKGRLLQLTPLKAKTRSSDSDRALWACTAACLTCRPSAPACVVGTRKVAGFDWDQEEARRCESFVPKAGREQVPCITAVS